MMDQVALGPQCAFLMYLLPSFVSRYRPLGSVVKMDTGPRSYSGTGR
jgi:hypothetical protein